MAPAARKPARAKVSADVLTEARKAGKVIEAPSEKDVAANPGARGYDEHGQPRPADARAAYLVVPAEDVEPITDPTPAERGTRNRDARKAAAKAAKAAAKAAKAPEEPVTPTAPAPGAGTA